MRKRHDTEANKNGLTANLVMSIGVVTKDCPLAVGTVEASEKGASEKVKEKGRKRKGSAEALELWLDL